MALIVGTYLDGAAVGSRLDLRAIDLGQAGVAHPLSRLVVRCLVAHGPDQVVLRSQQWTEEVRPITRYSGWVLSPHGRAVHLT
jgi:hypothetical protein